MTQKFARFCNVCYELFSDPVLYQKHVDVCGKVQATATEPAPSATMDVTDSTLCVPDGAIDESSGGEESDGIVAPDGATIPDGVQAEATDQEGTTETVDTKESETESESVPDEPPPARNRNRTR